MSPKYFLILPSAYLFSPLSSKFEFDAETSFKCKSVQDKKFVCGIFRIFKDDEEKNYSQLNIKG